MHRPARRADVTMPVNRIAPFLPLFRGGRYRWPIGKLVARAFATAACRPFAYCMSGGRSALTNASTTDRHCEPMQWIRVSSRGAWAFVQALRYRANDDRAGNRYATGRRRKGRAHGRMSASFPEKFLLGSASNKTSNISSNTVHCETCKSFDFLANFLRPTLFGRTKPNAKDSKCATLGKRLPYFPSPAISAAPDKRSLGGCDSRAKTG